MNLDFLEAARRLVEAEHNHEAAQDRVRSRVHEGREIGLTDKEIAESADLTYEELVRVMDESICRVCGNQRFTDKDFAELTRPKDEAGDERTLTPGDAMNLLGNPSLSPGIFATLVSFLQDIGIPESVIRKVSGLSDEEFGERMREE